MLVAVDIGGTFTDLMAFNLDKNQFFQAKSLTTPHDFSQGIINCIGKSGLEISDVRNLVHGTTVAINTLIERTGAKVALIVTKGTRDVYTVGRGNRPESYNLHFRRPRPLVPRHLTFEVDGRLDAAGHVIRPLNEKEVEAICARLDVEGIESVAVCLLHSFTNPSHEARIGEIMRARNTGCYVSLSHDILREFREYERMSTTAVNAYVGPRVSRYIGDLQDKLSALNFDGALEIMQSNGGVMSPAVARRKPAAMMESGPVGGIIASAEVGRQLGFNNVIAFDMGGTTAKASLIRNGEPSHAEGYYVEGYASGHPVMLPVIDVVEVGAGGGSIAWIDDVGALKVGPQSASADPGPVCYGLGGTEPTITDANVILGRVGASQFLGGEMPLDEEGARQAVKLRLSKHLGMSVVATADAIIRIAIAKMSLAVRQVSVEKGYDPRDFALIASGGAGPLHVVAIAHELSIPTVIIPRFPAHFSALGMLMANERHDLVRTFLRRLDKVAPAELIQLYEDMMKDATSLLSGERDVDFRCSVDLRYVGQEFCLTIPISPEQIRTVDVAALRQAFDRDYQHRYSNNATDEPVEVVNFRLAVIVRRQPLALPRLHNTAAATGAEYRFAVMDATQTPVRCPVYLRDDLKPGASFDGPALIQEYASTTVMFAGDRCQVAETGELVIAIGRTS